MILSAGIVAQWLSGLDARATTTAYGGGPDSLELSRGRRLCSFGYSVSRATPIDRATSTPMATSSAIISGLTRVEVEYLLQRNSDVRRNLIVILVWLGIRLQGMEGVV
ncbi:hypothetical protein [Rhodococcus sp. 24CO]|uniref:hypothetical protein n=1 Tax=Rhodococcus sp. 24CO TaxID=3117460 RepID=UPI003D350036